MARLVFTTDANQYSQLDTLSGTFSIDTEGDTFGGGQFRVFLPAYALDTLNPSDAGFQGPQDTYVRSDPVGPYNIIDIVCTTDQAPVGSVPLLNFTARVIGARGSTADLAADLLEGWTNDGAPLLAERVEISIPILPGNAGFFTDALAQGQASIPYQELVLAQGGTTPYSFSIIQGSLPAGLTFNQAGLIEGTPTFVGSSTFTLRLTDSSAPASPPVERTFTIDVSEAPPRILTDSLPNAAIARAYTVQLTSDGGTAPFTWQAEGLPAGLAISGSRITGTPAADRHTVGTYPVKLRVTDSQADARIAERVVELIVLPAYSFATVDVESPGEIVTARDMHVATYDVSLAASGSLAERDEELVQAHDAMEEALMTDIFNAMLFEETLTNPEERARFREAMGILLHEYKEVKQAGREAINLGVLASLYIDDVFVTHIGSWRGRLKGADWNARYSITRRESRTKKQKGQIRDFRRAMKRDQKGFSRWMMGVLDEELGPGKRKKRARSGKASKVERSVISAAVRFRSLIDDLGIDLTWLFKPDEDGQATVRLTPGAHRIRVTWSVSSYVPPGSIVGAMEAAGAQAQYEVTLDPRNPGAWPRFVGNTVVNGGGGRSGDQSQLVSIVGSDHDILVVSDGAVRLIAATGKADQPFAAPVDFAPLAGASADRLSAAIADEIGRTSVASVVGNRIRVAANIGPGGFASTSTTAPSPAAYSSVGFGPVTGAGRSRVNALAGNRVDVCTIIEPDPGEVRSDLDVSEVALNGSVRGDSGTAIAFTTLSSGENRLFVCEEWAGAVDEYSVPASASLTRIASLQGVTTVDPRRDPIDVIAGEFAPGAQMVVASMSQVPAIQGWRRSGSTWTAMAPVLFPFRTGRITQGMGVAGGIGMISRQGGYVVLIWWPAINEEARRLPVHIGGNASGIASNAAQFVISYGTLDKLEVFRPEL